MISTTSGELRARAERFAAGLNGIPVHVIEGQSLIGGGATPEQPLASWLVAIECSDVVEAERGCRLADPPVVARIEEGRLLLDLRTVFAGEEDDLRRVVRQACS